MVCPSHRCSATLVCSQACQAGWQGNTSQAHTYQAAIRLNLECTQCGRPTIQRVQEVTVTRQYDLIGTLARASTGEQRQRSGWTETVARNGTTAGVGRVGKTAVAGDHDPARGGLIVSDRSILECDLAIVQSIGSHRSSRGVGDDELGRSGRVKGKAKGLCASRGSEGGQTETSIGIDWIAIDQIGGL